MSNPLKSVGKIFKKVIRVVKKIALPVLAIGAVVLTGGAALGVLPAMGTMLSSVGITGSLAGILTSAGNAAMFGAIGSALTGGNILKGASMGFLTGGVMGALGSAVPGLGGKAASGAVNTASAADAASAAGVIQPSAASASMFENATAGLGGGTGGGLATAASGGLVTGGGTTSIASSLMAPTPTVAGAPNSNGILGSIFGGNSVIGGQMLSGLGQGLMQSAAMKDQIKAQEKEREARAANYEGLDQSLYRLPDGTGAALPNAADVYNQVIYRGSSAAPSKIKYDARTGRILPA